MDLLSKRNHGPLPILCDHNSVYQEFFFFFFFSINICLQLICIKPHHRIHVCDFSQSDIDMGVRNKYTTNAWEAYVYHY